jgi:hypothetical protein
VDRSSRHHGCGEQLTTAEQYHEQKQQDTPAQVNHTYLVPSFLCPVDTFPLAPRETTSAAAAAQHTASMGNARGQDPKNGDAAGVGNACGSLPVPGLPGMPVIRARTNWSVPVAFCVLSGRMAKMLVTVQGFKSAETDETLTFGGAITVNV